MLSGKMKKEILCEYRMNSGKWMFVSLLILFLLVNLSNCGRALQDNNSTGNISGYLEDSIEARVQDADDDYFERTTISLALEENKFSRHYMYNSDQLPRINNHRDEGVNSKFLFYSPNSEKLEADRLEKVFLSEDMQKNRLPYVKQVEAINPAENQTVDLEILIESSTELDNRIMKLYNLKYKKNMTLGVDELPVDRNYIDRLSEVESYAINLEGINFTEGRFTAIAKGNLLWKCALWNFTEQSCMGSWEIVQEIVPGREYDISLFPGDPGYVETYDFNQSLDVSVAALDDETIIIAWINNDTNYYASFEIWSTRGTLLVDQVNFETSGSANSRIDVDAINSTHFVLGLIDGPDQDIDFFIYNRSGSLVSGPTQIDASIGAIADVAVCELGDSFALLDVNSGDSDADFVIRWNNGNSRVAATNVDATTSPGANGQNLQECVALNDTKWVYLFFDDRDNDVTYALRNGSGSSLVAATDIDADVGETGQVAGASFGNNRFGVVFYDSTDDDISLRITQVTTSNTFSVIYTGDIDTDAGTDSRVAAAEVVNSATSYIVVAWQDASSGDIRAGVYNGSGSVITSPFAITTTETSQYKLLDVVGYNSMLGMGLCNYTFAIAYTNSSMTSVYETYWINGTRWDGRCPEYDAPNITIISPPNNTVNKSTSLISFYYNVSDKSEVSNCTIYINSTLNSTNVTITKDISSNFVTNLSNGNYSWKIGCIDEFGNARNSSLYNLNVSWYVPSILQVNPDYSITLNAGTTKKVNCNATVFYGNGANEIAEVNGTFFRTNITEENQEDNNTHYSNASCISTGALGNVSNYTCSFYVYYYAFNGTWNCSIHVFDDYGGEGNDSGISDINPLYALNLSDVTLDYGDVSPGTYSSDESIAITNYGNMPINVTVKGYGGDNPVSGNGYSFSCSSGANITIDNQRYSELSGRTFAQKKQLTSSEVHLNMTILKQMLPSVPVSNNTYWQIYVPPRPDLANCNGTIVFTVAAP